MAAAKPHKCSLEEEKGAKKCISLKPSTQFYALLNSRKPTISDAQAHIKLQHRMALAKKELEEENYSPFNEFITALR